MKFFQIVKTAVSRFSSSFAVITVILVMGVVADVQASPVSAWVSAGPSAGTTICDRSKPCQGFTSALGVIPASGGTVNAVNAGNYQPFTVSGSCVIDGTGTFAGVLVTGGGDGCIIGGGSPTDIVVLRNLTFEGNGTGGSVGINVSNSCQVIIENCVINGFDKGITIGSFIGSLVIINTTISNCSTLGICISGSTMTGQLSNVSILNIAGVAGDGIDVYDGANVNMTNCLISQCTGAGLSVGGSLVSCIDSMFTSNATAIECDATSSVYISNNDFYDNTATLSVTAGGTLSTANNNRVAGSTYVGSPTNGVLIQ